MMSSLQVLRDNKIGTEYVTSSSVVCKCYKTRFAKKGLRKISRAGLVCDLFLVVCRCYETATLAGVCDLMLCYVQVLRDNKIGREGAVAVCDLMLQNRCITKLDLSGEINASVTTYNSDHDDG